MTANEIHLPRMAAAPPVNIDSSIRTSKQQDPQEILGTRDASQPTRGATDSEAEERGEVVRVS